MLEPAGQRRAADVLHHHEHSGPIGVDGRWILQLGGIEGAHVVHRHDVGVGELRDRLGLADQSSPADRVVLVGDVGPQ